MLEFVPTDVQPALPHAPDPVVDEYHAYVYGVVPPEGWAVSVIVCPSSMLGEFGVMAPADSAGSTVTLSADEGADAGEVTLGLALSVTT